MSKFFKIIFFYVSKSLIMQTFLEWFWERFPGELQGNKDIECYDRVMEQHPNHNI